MQTVVIGNRSYKVKWNVEHKIHKLVCLVLNRNAEETRIYYLQLHGIETDKDITESDEDGTESDEDGIETDEDGIETDVRIIIYGLNEADEVLKMGFEQLGYNNVINLEHKPINIMNIPANEKQLTVEQNITRNPEDKLLSQLVFVFDESNQPADGTPESFYLQIIKYVKSQSIYMKITQTTGNRIECFKNIASRTELSVSIIKLEKISDMGYQVKDTSEEITFITHNSIHNVEDLLRMAKKYTIVMTDRQTKSPKGGYGRSVEVEYLSRCKPTEYMDEDFKAGIMRKDMKDNNGDPASSINNKIEGLFFTVKPELDGTLPEVSFFGDVRILIKPQDIINGLNLYFADFYCLYKRTHYVTLALTKPDSSEDNYCIKRLVQLDWKNNPFLKYDKTTDQYFTSNAFYFNVEVLYTEDLDLQQIRFIKGSVTSWGQGQSTPGGIPKNLECGKCNLPFH